MPPMHHALFVEGDMTNLELWDALIKIIQLMMTNDHVFNNHFVGQANQGDRPQQNASTLTSRIWDVMRMNTPTFPRT